MTIGLLLFNEIIIFPFFGFKEAVEKHKEQINRSEFGLSPESSKSKSVIS